MEMAEKRDVSQQILCKNSSQNIQVINDIPIIFPSTHPKDFEDQLEEIDTALNKFESHDFRTPNMTTGCSIVTAPSGENLGGTVNRGVSGEFQNVVHVENQPLTNISDTVELRKWKKLARNNHKVEADTQLPLAVKRGREEDEEIQLELPYKKHQVSRVDGQDISMAEAVQQPRQAP